MSTAYYADDHVALYHRTPLTWAELCRELELERVAPPPPPPSNWWGPTAMWERRAALETIPADEVDDVAGNTAGHEG